MAMNLVVPAQHIICKSVNAALDPESINAPLQLRTDGGESLSDGLSKAIDLLVEHTRHGRRRCLGRRATAALPLRQ